MLMVLGVRGLGGPRVGVGESGGGGGGGGGKEIIVQRSVTTSLFLIETTYFGSKDTCQLSSHKFL